MHAETLESLKRSAAIPSMPLVATRCYEMTQDPHCDYRKLVDLLATDPGIAADVLRLANSALFGVTRQVSSLQQAIALLGTKRIRELVMARYLVQKIQEMPTDLVDFSYFWRRSLTTAILAAKLAETVLSAQRDEAFIGGLLADVGVVVMARALPKKYGPIAQQYRPHGSDDWMHGEYNLMGVTHGEVSALVLEQWNLPENVVDAVRYHHARLTDLPADAPSQKLARVIGAAGMVAKILCEVTNVETVVTSCVDAMERVELDLSVLVRSLHGIGDQIEQTAGLLQVDVLNSKVFATIEKQLAAQLQSAAAGAA